MQKNIFVYLSSALVVLCALFFITSSASAAPVISSISTNTATPYTVTFTWNTSVPSNSWVDFDSDGSRYILQGATFVIRNPLSYVFFEYRDPNTNQMVGRCDGGGDVTSHCVTILTPMPNKLYPFRIKSCSDSGTDCTLSAVSSFTSALDILSPIRPTNLATTIVASDRIEFTWSGSRDNAPRYFPGYKIYRNNTLIKTIDPLRYTPTYTVTLTPSQNVLIDTVGNRDINVSVPIGNDLRMLNHVDLNVSPDTIYTYYVTAFDLGGNESLPSGSIQRRTPAICPPGFTDTETTELGAPLTCVPLSSTPPSPSGSPSPQPPVVSNVRVVTAAPYTATFTWDTSIPSDSWADIDPNGNSFDYRDPNTGQMIGRCDGGGDVTSHCVKLLTPVPAKTYQFRIKSCANSVTCTFSVISSFISAVDSTRPTTPTDLRTNITGAGDIELSWNPSRDDAPRYFPGYKIYRNGTLIKIIDALRYTPSPRYRDLNVNVPIELSNTRIQYVDFDVSPDTTYTYYVTALDLGGNESLQSDTIRVSTASVVSAPLITNVISSPAAPYIVTFTWNTSAPSDSWVDIDQDGSRYVLRGTKYDLVDPLRYVFPEYKDTTTNQMVGRCDGGGQVTNHCVKLVISAPGKIYPFRVRSCASGTKCALGDILSFTSAVDSTRPTTLTDLGSEPTLGATSPKLIWTPSSDDAPRYFPGYNIYRNNALIKTINPVRYTPPDGDLNPKVTIASDTNEVQYTDVEAPLNTNITYRITAFDLGNNASLQSNPLLIQCVSIPTPRCVPLLSRVLQLGSTGEDVKILQQVLIQEQVYPQAIVSGFFGSLTRQAVILFQEKYSSEVLTPLGLFNGTGIVGTLTRNKINQILLTNPQ